MFPDILDGLVRDVFVQHDRGSNALANTKVTPNPNLIHGALGRSGYLDGLVEMTELMKGW